MAAGDITVVRDDVHGEQGVIVGTMETGAYVTGGYTLGTATFGLSIVDFVEFEASAGYQWEYDRANDKVIARVAGTAGAPLDEEGNTTDLSAVDCRFKATGKK